jgi:HPt (histidine-containing phosphotransfer) domain-containing protein
MNDHAERGEIQNRLRKRFLDRLHTKLPKMRKELLDRNWPLLRTSCRQIKGGGEAFGFPELKQLAERAEASLPKGEITKAMALPDARSALDELIEAIDKTLVSFGASKENSREPIS